jgi:glycine betaine/proline transport system substrate-binding protein
MLVAAWLPHAHAGLHAPVAASVVEAAILYEEARLYLAVPDFADPSIVGIGDLARPAVAAAARREILGVAPGSGSARGTEAMLDAYGLRAAGWSLSVGSAAAWTAAIEAGMAERILFATPAWTPLWTERAFALRPLADPLGVYGGADRAVVLVRRDAWDTWPARSRAAVSRIAIPRAEVAAMDAAVVREGLSPDAAARGWTAANRGLVAGWLAGA